MDTCRDQVALLAVTSTVLTAIGYCQLTKLLILVFRSGAAYSYSDVPLDTFRALLVAESKGNYFNCSIRGVFRHTAILGPRGVVSVPEVSIVRHREGCGHGRG